jgi:GNAT superfamily N-acetyltransferase
MVCHTGIIQFPLKKGKKRVHRLVVIPDWQGIGIGTTFIKEVAKLITERGYELNLTTTTPALVGALKKSPNWILARFGREKDGMKGYDRYKNNNFNHLKNTVSTSRITYSFWYKQ